MADAIELENSDSLEHRLYIALAEKEATPLRDVLRTTTQVAIAELKAQLNAGAQSALEKLHRYCTRWDAKSPQQPRNTLDDPVPDEPYNPMREFERQRSDPSAYNPITEFDRGWRPHRYEPAPPLPPLPPPPAGPDRSEGRHKPATERGERVPRRSGAAIQQAASCRQCVLSPHEGGRLG